MKKLLLAALFALTLLVLAACSGGGQSNDTTGDTTATTDQTTDTTGNDQPLESTRRQKLSYLPNAQLHPGATNPDVTQDNIQDTVCVSGYSRTIRPPASYTDQLKRQQMRDEKFPGNAGDYEEDHLISLSLGGNPRDPKNLWPEPYDSKGHRYVSQGYGAESKDKVEYASYKLLCSGKMSLADIQKGIATDWYKLGQEEQAKFPTDYQQAQEQHAQLEEETEGANAQ